MVMKHILDNLNDEQREAVLATEGPLLILAGAGSGKTKTLTHRIAYLLSEKHVPQESILAATFTNKAAKEMRQRIAELLGMPAENRSFMPFMGTFHGLCVRILRRDAEHIGLSRNFVIFDTADQLTAVKQAMKEQGVAEKEFSARSILTLISGAKNEMLDPKAYEQFATTPVQQVAARVYKRYTEIIRAAEALDFDDLINKVVELLSTNPERKAAWRNQFQYLMVDEYQDTNASQYKLIQLLTSTHQNLAVVGDDWQSIYSWRGADFRNILNFEKDYKNAKVIKLERNYRSTQAILDGAHSVIRKNQQRSDKELWTENGQGKPICIESTMDEIAEGEFIVRMTKSYVDLEARRWNDFAVLYRTNAQSRSIEDVCIRYGIPYRVVGGVKFYDRKEVKDILAYLRFIFQPEDVASFLRIVNTPTRGIGQTSIQRFIDWSNDNGFTLWQGLQNVTVCPVITPRAVKALSAFCEMILRLREYSEEANVSGLIDAVIKRIQYFDFLEDGTAQSAERVENVRELQSVAQLYNDQGLAGFLEEVALIADVDTYDENSDALTLMTIHAAKGLEFPVVFVVGMEESIFPHSRALYDVTEMEEERRLCYVAMTRAKEELYLLHANRRLLYGGVQHNIPSRFLAEIDGESSQIGHHEFAPERSFMPLESPMPLAPAANFEPFQTASVMPKTAVKVSVGDRVRHKIFGTGEVVELQGDVATIKFSGRGLKKLNTAFAPLELI